jgi:quaternary ammonium compound-resistance protein SugE
MNWVVLFCAGLLEIVFAIGMKQTQSITRLWPSVWTLAAMVVSFGLLSQALKTIPVGTGYAVWTGIGAVGTAVVGMLWLGEPREIGRVVCLSLIVGGIVGLRFFSSH